LSLSAQVEQRLRTQLHNVKVGRICVKSKSESTRIVESEAHQILTAKLRSVFFVMLGQSLRENEGGEAQGWLNDSASSALTRRLEKVEGDYLFPGCVEGKPIVKVNNAHTATLKRCGVAHFTLYSLRHTWATRAAESGVDLVTLAAMLGHSKINMVLRYAHPTEQHQAAAMQKIQQRLAAR
jgi:integrase